VKHRAGKLHVLVNNVGTNRRKKPLEFSMDDFKFLMTVNVESAFNLCQLCHGMLKESGNGCIIFNSSVAGGPLAMKSGCVYAMTKGTARSIGLPAMTLNSVILRNFIPPFHRFI
jgi:tropinone reductase I